MVRVGSAPSLPKGARLIGSAGPTEQLRLDVVLKTSQSASLAAFDQAVSTPGSSQYHRFLSAAAFAATYDPPQATVAAVDSALRSAGLSPGQASANRLMIPVTATASQASAAFRTTIADYRLSSGRTVYANTSAASLPAEVAGDVTSVIGLDDLGQVSADPIITPKPRTPPPRTGSFTTPAGPQPCAAARAGATEYGSYTINQLANEYGFTGLYRAGDLGAGQTIALFEVDPFSLSELDTYAACFGLNPAAVNRQVSVVKVDGGVGAGTAGIETALDLDTVLGLAPDAHVEVYEAPNDTQSYLDEANQIVSDDSAQVVSISLGYCEPLQEAASPGELEAEDAIFEQAAAQGQTILAASGDSGSEACEQDSPGDGGFTAVSDPASQPYVTGVGGTDLTALTEPPSEVAWNEAGPRSGAGGGGFSSVWTEPAWQKALVSEGPEVSLCGPKGDEACRGVPDVSASADPQTGYTVYYQGAWQSVGGTSGATPLWAAVVALTNQTPACGGVPLGYIDPLLYQLGDAQYLGHTPGADYFDDITSGDNDYTGETGEYTAAPGWDPATGLGSPRLTNDTGSGGGLAEGLCASADAARPPGAVAPIVTGIAPMSGPDAGGTTVTVTGQNLEGASAVTFGTVEATGKAILSDTATKIVATAPAALVDPVSGLPEDGVARVTVTTPSGTSAVTRSIAFTYQGSTPVVTSVTPAGPVAGGTRVFVAGSGFSGASLVSFGAATLARHPPGAGCRPSETRFCVLNDDTIVLLSPSARAAGRKAGPVPVVVTARGGTSQAGAAISAYQEFDYLSPPEVDAVVPAGPPTGGYTVTVRGSGFAAYCGFANPEPSLDLCADTVFETPLVSAIQVGSGAHRTEISGDSVNVVSSSVLTFTMPKEPGLTFAEASSPGRHPTTVVVRVLTPGGSAGGNFVYTANGPGAPTVTAMAPTIGTTNGETPVHLTGTNFAPGMTVTFGGAPSNDILSVNAAGTAATVLSPGGSPGLAPVDVTTPWGSTTATNSPVGPNQFTYASTSASGPTVLNVAPDGGVASGGGRVTITGSGFFNGGPGSGVTAIRFGGVKATHVSCSLDTSCKATVPAHRPGTVAVTVTTGSGKGAFTSGASGGYDRFTYTAAPVVTGLEPSRGPAVGGTLVTITGSGFSGVSRVSFGDLRAARFSCPSATLCRGLSPAGSPGQVAVVVTNARGSSPSTSASQFAYLAPAVAAVAPDQGTITGGTTVLITGSGLTGASAVHFGKRSAESFTCTSDTSCVAISPPDSTALTDMMGQVDVTVTVRGVTSIDTPMDVFTYVPVP